MSLAPVVVLAFNRPEHTARLLASLRENPEASSSRVFVFCDGPRGPKDASAVEATRAAVRCSGIPDLELVERPCNLGLAANVVDGVTRVCAEHGRVIVLEDDLVVATTFLRFMNLALDRYADQERVYQVTGYMFPAELRADHDAVFLPFISSWGWGTWTRAWKAFDPAATGYELVLSDRRTRRRFDLDGAYTFSNMLRKQVEGRNNSWAIRWYLSVFRRGGLTLFPRASLVENRGYGTQGTHCLGTVPRHVQSSARNLELCRLPPVEEDEAAFEAVKRLMRADTTLFARGLRTARRYLATLRFMAHA